MIRSSEVSAYGSLCRDPLQEDINDVPATPIISVVMGHKKILLGVSLKGVRSHYSFRYEERLFERKEKKNF